MRAPSSFHSTAAGPVFSSAAVDVRRGRGQHGGDRPPDLQPELPEILARQRDRRHRAQVAAQHQRPPHVLERHVRGLGHRVADHGGQRALPDVPEHQRPQERLLGRGRAAPSAHPTPPAAPRPTPHRSATPPAPAPRPPRPRSRSVRRRAAADRRATTPSPRPARAAGASRPGRRRPRPAPQAPARAAQPRSARPSPAGATRHGRPRWRRQARRTARRVVSPTMTRTVLVTGASSGIGRAAALALSQRGFSVYAGARGPLDYDGRDARRARRDRPGPRRSPARAPDRRPRQQRRASP